MYLTAVIQTILLNHNPAKVTIETETEKYRKAFLWLRSATSAGGRRLHALARFKNNDGKMEYVIVNKVSRAMMFRLVPEFMNGTHMRFKQVRMGEFKKFTLTSDLPLTSTPMEIFTSFGSNLRKVDFEIMPQALKVVRG